MKKLIIFLCLAFMLFDLTACSSGSGLLQKPAVEAEGKKLYLPCTFGELLDFGFVFAGFSAIDLTEEDTPDNTTFKTAIGPIGANVSWDDGSLFYVEIKPLTNVETASRDCIVIRISDKEVYGEKDHDTPSGVLICGVSSHETIESVDEKFRSYSDSKGASDIRKELVAQDDSMLGINGYKVRAVNVSFSKRAYSDDSYVIRRSLEIEGLSK